MAHALAPHTSPPLPKSARPSCYKENDSLVHQDDCKRERTEGKKSRGPSLSHTLDNTFLLPKTQLCSRRHPQRARGPRS